MAAELRHRITRRDYAIGQSLPTESALCAEFDVSRGPVRQALATLRNEGLIRVSRGKPAVVRSHDAAQTLDTFAPFTQWAQRAGRTARQPHPRGGPAARVGAGDRRAGARHR